MVEEGPWPSLDGRWTCRGRPRGHIRGRRLTWEEGEEIALEPVGAWGLEVEMKYFSEQGRRATFRCTLRDDGQLHWSDGEVWTRAEGRAPPLSRLDAPEGEVVLAPRREVPAQPQGQSRSRLAQAAPSAIPGKQDSSSTQTTVPTSRRQDTPCPKKPGTSSGCRRNAGTAAPSGQQKVSGSGRASDSSTTIGRMVREGFIRWWRGSWGWVDCWVGDGHEAAAHGGYDVYLHANDCDVKPRPWDRVRFEVTFVSADGEPISNPRAIKAANLTSPAAATEPRVVCARDFFKERDAARAAAARR